MRPPSRAPVTSQLLHPRPRFDGVPASHNDVMVDNSTMEEDESIMAVPASSLFSTRATSTLSLQHEVPREQPQLKMDGFGIPKDLAINDNRCEDADIIHLNSGCDEKSPEIDEGCHGVDELVEVADRIVEPKVGMTFDTVEQAYNYYIGYARAVGFSVRKQRRNKSKSDRRKILRQELVCSCEGSYKKVETTTQKRRENRRFECKAMVGIKLVDGDKYSVVKFISEHSHDLLPSHCSHLLRFQRKIDFSQVELINKMHSSGLKQSDIFSYLCAEDGGAQHLNFTRSDCNNLVQRTHAEFFRRGDAQYLLNYFKQKQQENKQFYYSFRTNEECEIRGVFFCDAKSRRDYGLFGDAICFDTSFRTNNCDMVCAPIVGINNHGQTTLFGCGLLDGETTDAVLWLFTTFLEAMGGKKPASIFTDQSRAIGNAISVVFPEAHHGLCLWLIYQNAAKHLAKTFTECKPFAPRFKACIYDPETIDEFEHNWDRLLEDHGLRDNEWLHGLYELRSKWAQAYSPPHFCAGMSRMTTTQRKRSETINKFLKQYFGSSIVLRKFVDQYSKAMANRREKEREAESRIHQTSPVLISSWSIEREAAEKYTKKIFYCFQEEFKDTLDMLLELEKDDGTIRTYKAIEMEGQKKIRTLTYNHSEQSVSCTCRKFEFSGILCSHALKLFRELQYKNLPPQYYLKRWTRAIIDEDVFDPYGDLIPNDIDPLSTARYSELSHISQRIATKGSKLNEVFSLTKTALLELEANVEAWTISNKGRSSAFQKSTSDTINNSLSKKTSSKAKGGKAENLAMTHITTGASNFHQPTFGLGQQPSYNQNGFQGMYPRGINPPGIRPQGIHPQGMNSQDIHPQGIYPPYNFLESQQQRPYNPNDSLMSQQASSSQTHAPQEMPRSMNFLNSSTSNFSPPRA